MESYKTGNGPQDIFIQIDITTIGISASRAVVGKPGSGVLPVEVATSNEVSGDIKQTTIGKAVDLAGKLFNAITKVDLSAIGDKKARELESKRINSVVTFDNGIDGNKVFKNADKRVISTDFKTVHISTNINLLEI